MHDTADGSHCDMAYIFAIGIYSLLNIHIAQKELRIASKVKNLCNP